MPLLDHLADAVELSRILDWLNSLDAKKWTESLYDTLKKKYDKKHRRILAEALLAKINAFSHELRQKLREDV